jgi:antitoxin CptB
VSVARLRWRCRRGMRELDAVLQQFLLTSYAELDAADMARFEAILDLPDPDLYAYLAGRSEPTDLDIGRLIKRIGVSFHPAA